MSQAEHPAATTECPQCRDRAKAERQDRWSWYDPMNPTHYAMFALGMWAGANLVGLAWLAAWLWT